MENICRLMEDNMKAIGYLIKCMVMGDTHGKTVKAMKDNTIMIKNMGMEYMFGLMEEDMKDIGRMVKGKEEVNMFYQVESAGKVSGTWIKELDGYHNKKPFNKNKESINKMYLSNSQINDMMINNIISIKFMFK